MFKKIKRKVIYIALCTSLVGFSTAANAFDIVHFFRDLFTATAGDKSVDDSDGLDISKFQSPNQCQSDYPWGPPVTKDKDVLKRALYMCRHSYAIQYDPKLKVPLWTQEVLQKDNLMNPIPAVTEYYVPDPEIPKKMQATIADYNGSGYTYLNMSPALDMIVHNGALPDEQLLGINKQAIKESFYLTNAAPIKASLVSQNGLWRQLEEQTRAWAVQKNRVFVITGALYLGGQTQGFMGQSKVAVPTHYFKIITQPLTYGSIAYIIPNKDIATAGVPITDPKNTYYCNGGACSLDNFIVPIKEVEKVTGFETYSKLAPGYAVRVKQDINELFKKKQ